MHPMHATDSDAREVCFCLRHSSELCMPCCSAHQCVLEKPTCVDYAPPLTSLRLACNRRNQELFDAMKAEVCCSCSAFPALLILCIPDGSHSATRHTSLAMHETSLDGS